MDDDAPRCGNCRFYHHTLVPFDTKVCRRRAPVVVPANEHQSSFTWEGAWCGEHEAGQPYLTPPEQHREDAERKYQSDLKERLQKERSRDA